MDKRVPEVVEEIEEREKYDNGSRDGNDEENYTGFGAWVMAWRQVLP